MSTVPDRELFLIRHHMSHTTGRCGVRYIADDTFAGATPLPTPAITALRAHLGRPQPRSRSHLPAPKNTAGSFGIRARMEFLGSLPKLPNACAAILCQDFDSQFDSQGDSRRRTIWT